MKPFKSIWFFIALTFAGIGSAQEEENKVPPVEIKGYIKDLQGMNFTNNLDSLSSINILHNRINLKVNASIKLSARIEIRNRLFWGDQVNQIQSFSKLISRYNGLVDLSHIWIDKRNFVMHTVIDRLLLQYQSEKWDIKLGRQRINWGINNTWNPNDIFNAYDILDFDYEERPGNDAIRIQHYTPKSNTVELACKPGKKKNETIAALLYKFNKKNTDWQLLAGIFQQDWVLGSGWAGSIKKAGFKGEISYFHPRKNWSDTNGTISASLMADQTFEKEWYFSLAVLFNSNPQGIQAFGGNIFGNELSAKQLFPYRYALYSGMMKSFSPVLSMNTSIIYSPEKNTLIIFPSFSWNAAANLDINFIAQTFFAHTGQQYKTLGNAIFLRTKWSF